MSEIVLDRCGHYWWWEPILGAWSDGVNTQTPTELQATHGPLIDPDTAEPVTLTSAPPVLCLSTRYGAGCGHPVERHDQGQSRPCCCCSGRHNHSSHVESCAACRRRRAGQEGQDV